MLLESSSNAKSSQDYASQGFAASTTSNHSSIAMNAAQQEARNLASSVSVRITLPNTCSGMAFKTHQAIANADNQKPVPNIKSSSSVRAPVPPEELTKQLPMLITKSLFQTSSLLHQYVQQFLLKNSNNLPFHWLRRKSEHPVMYLPNKWFMNVNLHHYKRHLYNAIFLQSLKYFMMVENKRMDDLLLNK